MFKLHCLLASAIACVLPLAAGAQEYPAKPIELIVGFAPGGFTDVAARMIAIDLQKRVGQPLITLVASSPLLMIVNPAVAAKGVASFIALAKKDKHALRFASSGSGSSQHLGTAQFVMTTQTEMTHVP